MKQYLLSFIFLAFTLSSFAQDSGTKRNIYVSAYLDQVERAVKSGGNAADLSVRESVKYNQAPQAANEKKPPIKRQDFDGLSPDKGNGGFRIHSLLEDTAPYFGFGPTTKTIQGYSTYRIEFIQDVKISDTPPITIQLPGASELRFPISGYFAGGQVSWHEKLKNQERHDLICITLDWYTHAAGSRGRMRDSDWFGYPFDGGRAIYSESRAQLHGYGADGRFVYNALSFGDSVFTGPMLGIKYEKFQFKCSDLEQIGNGVWAPYFTGTYSGPDINYTVESIIPYLGWSADIFFNDKYSLKLAGGYSFLADVRDRDDHLLRSKLSQAHCKGSAAFVDGKLSWDIDPHWQLSTALQYLYLATYGRQIQEYYDGSSPDKYGLDDQIKSTQFAVDVGLTYKF